MQLLWQLVSSSTKDRGSGSPAGSLPSCGDDRGYRGLFMFVPLVLK